MCPTPDSTLADPHQISADLQRQLAECRAERDEALARETAMAEVLQVINSSPGDRTPVFEAILEKARILCGADHGSLSLYDGDRFCAVAINTRSRELADRMRQGFLPSDFPYLKPLLDGARLVHLPDLAEIGSPYGARTGLFVPLRKDDAFLGMISTIRLEIRPFSDKEIALVENFAAQAVIAMENARLLTETREALEQQTATAEVLQVINSSPGDLAPVFDAILERAHSICGVDYGSLQLYDGQHFRGVAARGLPEPLVELVGEPYAPDSNAANWGLLRGGRFCQVNDLAVVVARSPAPNSRARLAVELGGMRTLLFVPLRKDDKLLGQISAARKEVSAFSDKEIVRLESFAAQAVIAMENARLLDELHQRTDQVAELNRGLEARVAEQVEELGRVRRLKRFLAPQLAELIVSQGDEKILESHRREIVVVFCDLRGYTGFTETAEPEEVLDFLREYHGALGPLVSQFEGTLDQFSGDGIMVFFNDPVPIPDPARRAVNMAVAMREAAGTLIGDWRERGRDLGFGAGIAQGYATLRQIGFSERSGYTAIGTVCNVAARLCAEAKDGQILLSQRVNVALKGSVATEQVGPLALKGLAQPVVAYNVPLAGSQAALRVIEGGTSSA
jgi:class 3 adenylate cyclase